MLALTFSSCRMKLSSAPVVKAMSLCRSWFARRLYRRTSRCSSRRVRMLCWILAQCFSPRREGSVPAHVYDDVVADSRVSPPSREVERGAFHLAETLQLVLVLFYVHEGGTPCVSPRRESTNGFEAGLRVRRCSMDTVQGCVSETTCCIFTNRNLSSRTSPALPWPNWKRGMQ